VGVHPVTDFFVEISNSTRMGIWSEAMKVEKIWEP